MFGIKRITALTLGIMLIILINTNTAIAAPEATASPTPTPSPTPEPSPIDGILRWPGKTPPPAERSFIEPDIIAIGTRGETVMCVQRRLKALGYYNYKATGYFAYLTYQALINFQKQNNLTQDGTIGQQTISALFSPGAKKADVKELSGLAKPPEVRPREYGIATPWEQVDKIIPEGEEFLVIDLFSTYYFKAVRTGGEYHMEVETTDSAQYERFLAMFSGAPSYEKRPVLIEYNDRLIAASLYGYPHGESSNNSSGMDGHTCLYFKGSVAHKTLIPDAEHDKNILTATGN